MIINFLGKIGVRPKGAIGCFFVENCSKKCPDCIKLYDGSEKSFENVFFVKEIVGYLRKILIFKS